MPSQPPTGSTVDPADYPDLPLPPINSFVSSKDAMKGAEDTSYLGRLTPEEAKQLVTKSVTVTRWTDMMADYVANDSRFGYESKAEFFRHAIEMLLEYYRDNKAFLKEHDGFANDILRRQHQMRLDAERARIRTEFRDNVTRFDDEIDSARTIGDYEYIADRLQKYREMLLNCESETQKRLLREILAGSVATRSAVVAFYQWVHSQYRAPVDKFDEAWKELATTWADFYQQMQVT